MSPTSLAASEEWDILSDATSERSALAEAFLHDAAFRIQRAYRDKCVARSQISAAVPAAGTYLLPRRFAAMALGLASIALLLLCQAQHTPFLRPPQPELLDPPPAHPQTREVMPLVATSARVVIPIEVEALPGNTSLLIGFLLLLVLDWALSTPPTTKASQAPTQEPTTTTTDAPTDAAPTQEPTTTTTTDASTDGACSVPRQTHLRGLPRTPRTAEATRRRTKVPTTPTPKKLSNPWNAFQHSLGGKSGLTPTMRSRLYAKHDKSSAELLAAARGEDWTQFERHAGGVGLTPVMMRNLYEQMRSA